MFEAFNVVFIVAAVLVGLVFLYVIALFISPKLKGKMMSREVKARKYMMDESKEDLKNISDNMAYATKDGIITTACAIKEGFTEKGFFANIVAVK